MTAASVGSGPAGPGPEGSCPIVQAIDQVFVCVRHLDVGRGQCRSASGAGWAYLNGGVLALDFDDGYGVHILQPAEWGRVAPCAACGGEGEVDGDDPGPDVLCGPCGGSGYRPVCGEQHMEWRDDVAHVYRCDLADNHVGGHEQDHPRLIWRM